MHMRACNCTFVCMREGERARAREREKKKERKGEGERGREGEGEGVCKLVWMRMRVQSGV